jgi:hypothetical protein
MADLLLVIGCGKTMHRLNKDARMLRVNVLMDAVAEVKDVAFP